MAKINAINNAAGSLTLDPGASGDSFVQFDINTTGEFRIGVDDTDDSFRISQGSALGANDTFIMTDAGERTMPLQPAFAGFLGSTDADVTGNGAQYILGGTTALTEIFDQGGDFTTAGVFTAPVTGRYVLSAGFLIEDAATATDSDFIINTSNRVWRGLLVNPSSADVGGDFGYCFTVVADMDALDTVDTRITVSGVGADTVDVSGGATDPVSWFTGYLGV